MRRLTPNQIALIAGGLLVIAFVVWIAVGIRQGNPDKLSDSSAAQTAVEAPSSAKSCAAQSTFDLIKREIFRRAALLRGGDQAAFGQVEASAMVRIERPVLESDDDGSGTIACSGSLTLGLPPGVATADGRSSLAADIGYSLQRSTAGETVSVTAADSLIGQLASLAKVVLPSATPPPVDPLAPVPATAVPPGAPPPPVIVPPPPTFAGRPSFNCASAHSRGEMAVCADPGLAALDRQMAAQYGAALRGADPDTRAALQSSGQRFLSYREQCGSNACVADAYRGRMREIRDIASGALR
jgi:hypothetical protein